MRIELKVECRPDFSPLKWIRNTLSRIAFDATIQRKANRRKTSAEDQARQVRRRRGGLASSDRSPAACEPKRPSVPQLPQPLIEGLGLLGGPISTAAGVTPKIFEWLLEVTL
jgi:hypothetical protein